MAYFKYIYIHNLEQITCNITIKIILISKFLIFVVHIKNKSDTSQDIKKHMREEDMDRI